MNGKALSPDAPVAVIGAGAMGRGIAQVAAAAGHPVLLYDAAKGQAAAAPRIIAGELDRRVAKGRMTAADRDALLGRIRAAEEFAELAPAMLAIEAVVEKLEVKQQVFAALEDICAPDAVLASNSSSLSPTAIARPLKFPGRLLGMHFFNPAPVMKLVEVIRGLETDATVAETVFATAAAWGKRPAFAAPTPGFIVNRVARPFYAEAWRLLEENAADAATIDALLQQNGGYPMGPFALMDLIGHDVNYAVTCSVFEAFSGEPRFRPSLLQRERVQGGFLGRKSGRGIYDYRDGATPPAPADAAPAPAPKSIVVEGDLGPAAALPELFQAAGVEIRRQAGAGVIRLGTAALALTDGRPALLRSVEEGGPVVLFDWAADYAAAPRIALTASPGAEAALQQATGLFQAAGKDVSVIRDCPGMVVMRTAAMLANEAADAAQKGVGAARDIDDAMRGGLNHRIGPLTMADRIGTRHVLAVLDALARWYGDGRCCPAGLLRRKGMLGEDFLHQATQ